MPRRGTQVWKKQRLKTPSGEETQWGKYQGEGVERPGGVERVYRKADRQVLWEVLETFGIRGKILAGRVSK